MKEIKLNIGCNIEILDGYINIDKYYESDKVLKADAANLPFPDNYADEVLASHLIEHFYADEIVKILNEWKRVLCHGGRFVIECPNIVEAARLILAGDIEAKRKYYSAFFGLPWIPGNTHKFGYTKKTLQSLLESIGLINIQWEDPRFCPGTKEVCMRCVSQKP